MKLVPLLALTLIFLSCLGARPSSENILLYFDKGLFAPAFPDKAPRSYPLKVQVRPLKVDPLYDNAKIIVRLTDYSVNYSRRGGWAIRPQITASDLLLEFVKANFSLKAVRESFSDEVPDFTVSGTLKAAEEDLRNGERSATLALTLKVAGRDDKAVYEETFRKTRPCADDGYAALAREFSLGLNDIYRSFTLNLDKILLRASEEKSDTSKG